jgi:long-chain fatty acid transport protein
MTHKLAKRGAGLVAALLVGALCALDAHAGGFFLPGKGVRPLGRGGAVVASGQGDLNAIWYNPANLATLEGTTLTVDLALIDLAFTFDRAPRTLENGDTIFFERVANEAPPKADPQILSGGKLNEELGWGFGFYAPYLSGHTFPENGAQRYTLIDNDASLLLYTHFALGWQLNEHVRIGAGIQNVFTNFVVTTMVSGYVGAFGDPEDEDLDMLTEVTVNSLFNPTGNAGVWVKLHESVEAALSFQLPVTLRDREAKIRIRFPSHPAYDNAKQRGDTLDTGISFPLMARLGARLVKPTWDVELALTYENWASFDTIQADPNDVSVDGVPGLGSILVAPLALPMNWQDTYAVALGGQKRLGESFDLRAGYTFETNTIPDDYYSVFLADAAKHQLSLGGTWRAGESLSLDFAGSYFMMPDRTITTSKVRQINPADTEQELSTVVGNGVYSQRYLIFGMGVNYLF